MQTACASMLCAVLEFHNNNNTKTKLRTCPLTGDHAVGCHVGQGDCGAALVHQGTKALRGGRRVGEGRVGRQAGVAAGTATW